MRRGRAACSLVMGLLMVGCQQTEKVREVPSEAMRDGKYPARWWEPVDRAGAPGWEIFPDEAGPGEVILSKRNELGLLSNFAATPFVYRGKKYASVEGFWQMMKYPEGPEDERAYAKGIKWAHTRDEVAKMTSFEANRAGKLGEDNMKAMGITYVTFEGRRMEYREKTVGEHYRLVVEAMRAKVEQNEDVRRVLLSTGDLVLKPDHKQDADAPAEWRYYEIMMQLRGELRKAQAAATNP